MQGLVGSIIDSIIDSIMGFLVSLIHLVGSLLVDKGEQGEPAGPEFLLRTNEFISSLLD